MGKKYTMADPYLIRDGAVERCSICGHRFPNDVKPSISVAFAEHLSKAHQSGQASEDVDQRLRSQNE